MIAPRPFRRNDWACALLAGVPWLAWSWRHAAPGLTFHDSGEYGLAAATWGIPHPPGAPTWVLAAGAFTRLGGFDDPVRGTNLFSGFCAALTLTLLALLVRRWLLDAGRAGEHGSILGGLAAAAGLAAVPAFQDQSLITEQYTLLTALLVGVLLAADAVRKRAAWCPTALLGLLWGLSCGNHLSQLALGTVVLWAVLAGKGPAPLWRRAAVAAAGWSAGSLVFVWMVLRARAVPLLNWGDVGTLERLWWSLTRQDWAGRSLAEAPDGFVGDWLASLGTGSAAASLLMLAGTAGLVVMGWRSRRRAAWLLLASVPYGVGILVAHLRQDGIGLDYIRHYGVGDWHLPLYLAAAAGLGWLVGWSAGPASRDRRTASALLAVALILLAGAAGREGASRRGDNGPARYVEALMAPLPEGALVALSDADPAFMLGYARNIGRRRTDLTVAYTRPGPGAPLAAVVAAGRPWLAEDQVVFVEKQWADPRRQPLRCVPDDERAAGSILVTMLSRQHPEAASRLLPVGMLFRVTTVDVDSSRVRWTENYWRECHPDLVPTPDPVVPLAERAAWARLHLLRAEYFTAHGLWDLAERSAEQAVAWLPDQAVAWYNLGFVRMMLGRNDAAEEALRRALAADFAVGGARSVLARLLIGRGEPAEARRLLLEELRRHPQDAQARSLLDYLDRP